MRENQSKSWPKSSDKNTSKKEEDVPLDEIVKNVSSYLKKFSHFKKYEKDIQKKYQKYYDATEALPDCWPVEFINEAWRETKTMYKYSGRKKCWSLAILFQVMKRSCGYDENEREAQTDVKKESPSGGDPSAKEPVHNPSAKEPVHNPSANEPVHNPSAKEPVYIRIPFSEMINGKECYTDTDTNIDEKNKESKFSETDEKNKENKASESVAMDKESKASDTDETINIKEYKLIDKVPSPTQILQNQFYITLYDNQTRNAAWVYEILNKSTLADNVNNKVKPFKKDKSVHVEFQTPDGEKPFSGTGYDRGHLAAAANHRWCQEAYDDTYWLSNAVPQQYGFNRGMWLELEGYCRERAMTEEVRNVHVYTGPLYLSSDTESKDNKDQNKSNEVHDDINDQNTSKKLDDDVNAVKKRKISVETMKDVENKRKKVIKKQIQHVEYEGVGRKAVPTHLFKVIIVENKDGKVEKPECYKIPNASPNKDKVKNLEPYKVEIEDIQRESGLIFEEREVKEENKDNQTNSGLKDEITDETWKMQWRAKNHEVWIKVSVSGSYTDHSDRAVLH